MSAQNIITDLVTRTHRAASGGDVRNAFAAVVAALEVPPEEAEAWRDGTDIIGATYERLFAAATRRELGQFFSPFWAGDVMAAWVLAERRALVLDPGCGSGGLLIPAARHERRGSARLIGIDRDPLAVDMARRNRDIRGIDGLELRVGDFLADELETNPDAIVCNPPYAKLDARQKEKLVPSIERRLGIRLDRRTPLHVLFLVRALEVCAPGGAIAFITPAGWLDAAYGKPAKEFLVQRAHVVARIVFEATHLFFPGARTTAEITLIHNVARKEKTKIIRLPGELPAPDAVLAAVEGRDGSLRVSTRRLRADRSWSRQGRQRTGVKLGDLARVRRGVATGCNRFFVVSEQERRALSLALSVVVPCVTSPRVVAGNELTPEGLAALPTDTPRWLIDCDDPAEETAETPLGRYLRSPLAATARKSYLAQHRTPWYARERRDDSQILFSYFNKRRPRFVRNRASAVPLNTWLSIEPNEGVDADELWSRLEALKPEKIALGARHYGGGLWKLEPRELDLLVVP